MSLNVKDEETVALVSELARRLGRTKTGIIRELARDRLQQLDAATESDVAAREQEILEWARTEVWPLTRGRTRLTKAEEEALMGYDEMTRR